MVTKITLTEAELESIAGGNSEHSVTIYYDPTSQDPVMIPEERYQKMVDEGQDVSHLEQTEIKIGMKNELL